VALYFTILPISLQNTLHLARYTVSYPLTTSFCRFVATHTVITVFRCCAAHGSPFTGQYCNLRAPASCNILSAIATQSVHYCNMPSTIATGPPRRCNPFTPAHPPLQHFSRASTCILQHPVRHCNIFLTPDHCNMPSTIATGPPHRCNPFTPAHPPLQHFSRASTCILQHPVCHCNIFLTPDLSAVATQHIQQLHPYALVATRLTHLLVLFTVVY